MWLAWIWINHNFDQPISFQLQLRGVKSALSVVLYLSTQKFF